MTSMFATLLCLTLAWHPFHTSLAEAQWSPDGTKLQVALRLSPNDLEAALGKFKGRKVVLEKETQESRNAMIEEYLREVIYLSCSESAAKESDEAVQKNRAERFKWVGSEDEVRYIWVYFELTRDKQDTDEGNAIWLTHRGFFEVEPTQINTVQLVKTEEPFALRLTRSRPTQKLPPP